MAGKLGTDGPKRGWTDGELSALAAVAEDQGMPAYHAWGALTNYSKSFDAFEVKRRRVVQSDPAMLSALSYGSGQKVARSMVKEREVADFVGLNMAYWDLETTFSNQPIVLFGASADQFGRVTEFRKGPDICDDHALVVSIRDALEQADVWVTWNGKLFDVPVLNGRLRFHGERPLEPKMHIDAMYKASGGDMRIGRRSLQSVSEYFGVENRKTPLKVEVWNRAMAGSVEAYELIAEHGHADVLVTRDVFNVLKPQVRSVHR